MRRPSPKVRTLWRLRSAALGVLLTLPLAGLGLGIVLGAELGRGLLPLAVVPPLVGAGIGLWHGTRAYERYRYDLDDERVLLHHGVVFRSEQTVPLLRLQHVDLARGPLERALGLASLTIHTAAPSADVELPGIAESDVEQLRADLLDRARSAAARHGVTDVDAV